MAIIDFDNDPQQVREIQQSLRILSRVDPAIPWIAVDGFYGADTRQAVTAFQRNAQLPVTGIVDSATWDALTARALDVLQKQAPALPVQIFPPDAQIQLGDRSQSVFVVQILINGIHQYYPQLPAVPISGTYDESTQRAVRLLQDWGMLEATGVIDKSTWDLLVNAYEHVVQLPPIRSDHRHEENN